MTETRNRCRYEKPCAPVNLKQALECAVRHHPTLKPEEICAQAEVLYRDMKHYYNPSQDRDIPARKLANVVRITGRDELFDFLLADAGLSDRLLVMRRQEGQSERELLDEVLEAQEATGHVAKVVREARSDRRYDVAELEAIERSAGQAEVENAQVALAARRMRLELESRQRFPKVAS